MDRSGKSRRLWTVLGVSAFFLLLLLLLVARAMSRDLNRDEEQFVSAGTLLLRHGFLPYQDYPYFHTPNLAFVFATLFAWSDRLLLSARAFNIACAWFTLLLIFVIAARAFREWPRFRWSLAALAALVLFGSELFQFTAGRGWNHDLSVLASLGALVSLFCSKQRRLWICVSGILLGLAIGTRLSFLPLVAPFGFFAAAHESTASRRAQAVLLFLLALALSLMPTWWLWAQAPRAFFFDNVVYNSVLNRAYAASLGKSGVSLGRRLFFPIELLKFPQNFFLVATFACVAVWQPLRTGWKAFWAERELAMTVCSVPFLLLGAFAPSPAYKQYYYALVPFLIVGVVFGLARGAAALSQRRAFVLGALTAASCLVVLLLDLPMLRLVGSPQRWTAMRVHEIGKNLRTFTKGKVLTLSPIFPLEGGLDIYRELATGPFAWRVAPLVPEKVRASVGMVAAADLAEFLTDAPPSAVLTGFATYQVERPLDLYARGHGYRLRHIPDGLNLWLPRKDKAK